MRAPEASARHSVPRAILRRRRNVYISSLPFAAVTIVASGRRCRIITEGEPAPGETIAHRYFFKPSHVDLLLATIGPEGLSGKLPAALADAIVQAAATLGAPFRTADELRRGAENEVDKIVAKVAVMRLTGEMKEINKRYREYRLAAVAMGKKAKPYSAYLQHFTAGLVRGAAARMI